jgi:hypothetical protein
MSQKFASIAAVCALLTVTNPAHPASSETPHLEFVKLYIEQLGAIEDIRDAAAKELRTDPDTQRVADCVHKRIAGSNHDIEIHDMHQPHIATRAKQHGVRNLPGVVVDGKLAGCCAGRGRDEAILREAIG